MHTRAHTHNKEMTQTEKDGTGLTKIFVILNLDDGFLLFS